MERLERKQHRIWQMAMLTLKEFIMELIKMRGSSSRMKSCCRGLLRPHLSKLSSNQVSTNKTHPKCKEAMTKRLLQSNKS